MINYIWNPKTFIKNVSNPCKPGIWCTSINIDYSKVTAVSSNKFFSFPTNIRRATLKEDITDSFYDNYIGYRNLFGTEYFVGVQYDSDSLDDRGHLSELAYWEQAEFFRVLFETVMGLSLLGNKMRTYSGEPIQVACSLPQEFDDNRYWVIIRALEGYHIFDLYLPETDELEHFDFTISRILTEPKSFVYSLTDIYREKPEYSDLFKNCPFMFGAELALYLHMNDHKS